MSKHLVVWVDHQEAHILRVDAGRSDCTTVEAHGAHSNPPADATVHPAGRHLFREVVKELQSADGILLVGPSTAKLELLRYVRKHSHDVERRIVGIETVSSPSDQKMSDYAVDYFERSPDA